MTSTTFGATASSSDDQLARILNTAVISSRANNQENPSEELCRLMETQEFKAILGAIRQLSADQGIPEKDAAEQVVSAFRKLDEIWSRYVFLEGIDKLKQRR